MGDFWIDVPEFAFHRIRTIRIHLSIIFLHLARPVINLDNPKLHLTLIRDYPYNQAQVGT